jgi:KaiC/GvpD/RAD55 family RecA-like ATPase
MTGLDLVEADPGPIETPWPFEEQEPEAESARSMLGYRLLDLDAFLSRPSTPPDFDWAPRIARGDLALLAGDPGVGKSLVALALAAAMAGGGGEVLGESVASRLVAYADLESPEDVLRDRLRPLVHDIEPGALAYLWRPEDWRSLVSKDGRARLRATLEEHRCEFCIVDSLRRAAPDLDENDSKAVSELFTPLREITKALGCTIAVVHHPRKPAANGPEEALYAARGSGDLLASVDTYLYFRRLKGGLVRIEHAKSRRAEAGPLHYRIGKGEDGAPLLTRVELNEREADEELEARIEAWVAEHPGEAKAIVEAKVTGSGPRIRAAIERMEGDERLRLVAGVGRAWRAMYVYPASYAGLGLVPSPRTNQDEPSPGSGVRSFVPSPLGDDEPQGTNPAADTTDAARARAEADG